MDSHHLTPGLGTPARAYPAAGATGRWALAPAMKIWSGQPESNRCIDLGKVAIYH